MVHKLRTRRTGAIPVGARSVAVVAATAAVAAAAAVAATSAVATSIPAGRTDAPAALDDRPPTWAFTGGRWLDGERFVERTLYAAAGVFTTSRPAEVDSTIDLSGMWMVPPFGEAHNHNLEDSRLDATMAAYVEHGIFYVANPDAIPRFVERARPMAALPTTVDGSFAMGGWTGPGGHPLGLFERNLARGIFRDEDGEGAFFRVVEDAAGVAAKWDDFLADRPDFVKVYLLYSDRPVADVPEGWRGLNRESLVAIVRRAHATGLPVAAHVETAADFRMAIDAAVDVIAHLPGFRPGPGNEVPDASTHGIAADDARRAAGRGIAVVTTASFASRVEEAPPALLARWRDVVESNLRTLKEAGVAIAVGSDDYGRTSRTEAEWLASLDFFSNAEALRMWAITTPRTIFPGRRIGRFEDGYEASFLALRANPLDNFAATGDIAIRFKQGTRMPASTGNL